MAACAQKLLSFMFAAALFRASGAGEDKHDCDDGLSNWKETWSPAKIFWCCQYRSKACVSANHQNFDCDAGLLNWESGWSASKIQWCCTNTGKGCAEGVAARAASAASTADTTTTTTSLTTTTTSTAAAAANTAATGVGCCTCSRMQGGDCKDARSKHTRKKSFCTNQASYEDCLSAGGAHWVSAGTCRWTCPRSNSRTEL
eukprot:TRINITY_DN109896_c0_g1_i1.p1 TRINITY_DN109896_c0_g1~~TRINITY_DN109896_c0_g1_i1.p1  ORF type:complete len:201 (+),score=31.37 TRINITY_DN109896_c0_g1_i1:75-677(+)